MTANHLSLVEIISLSALNLACQGDKESILAWPAIADDCRDLASTPREQCLLDVTDTAMDLADRGHVPDPLALLAGWLDWETEERAIDILTA